MRQNKKSILIGCLLLALILTSCSAPSLPPKETVKLYLDELSVLKDPLYKKLSLDELGGDTEKTKRYKEATKTVKGLLWHDSSSLKPERRKKLLLAAGTIITYKGYKITEERIKEDKAFVTVIFEKTSLFNKDLGKASQEDSKPFTYELIKTSRGWRIKDINGILAKRGL